MTASGVDNGTGAEWYVGIANFFLPAVTQSRYNPCATKFHTKERPAMSEELTATPEAVGLTAVQRVVNTFIAPSKTFEDIKRNRNWALPFILIFIASLCFTIVAQKKVGFDRMYEQSLKSSPSQAERFDSMTPEQKTSAMKLGTTITEVISYSYTVFILIIALISSLVLWGSFNFLLGAQTTFKDMMAVWMFASLTGLVSVAIMILTIYAGGADTFNVQDPIGTNIGYYMGPDTAPWLKSLLASFDIMKIWFAALLIIGTSIVAKVKRGSAAAVIIGWWVLIILVSVAIKAVTG